MDVLFIGGVFSDDNSNDIIGYTKGSVDFSANIFQQKLIDGIKDSGAVPYVLSVPFIGAFPRGSKKLYCSKKLLLPNDEYKYLSFLNLWGVRQFSRTNTLKRAIKADHKKGKNVDVIMVYSTHTPFMKAAIYAKRFYPDAKLCLVVPDLPQYMNLNDNRTRIYDFFKTYDVKGMEKMYRFFDLFLILTEPMKEVMGIQDKPYIVIEGLVDPAIKPAQPHTEKKGTKTALYTGKLNKKFGLEILVDAFMKLEGDYKLQLCGAGDAVDYILACSKKDPRITYLGQVSPEVSRGYINSSDVLVNPRQNNEEYTKYSFPSKNIDYLMSGKPVVAYMLDGIPHKYREFFVVPDSDSTEDLSAALERAFKSDGSNGDFYSYAKENLVAGQVIKRTIEVLGL